MSLFRKFFEKRAASNPEGFMNVMDHIEAFRWHLIRSIIAVLIGAIVVFINIEFIFDKIILGPANTNFISYKWLCKLGRLFHTEELCLETINLSFQNTELSGQFMMSFSVAFMLGFILVFPYIFWEFWRFIRPALKEVELKHAKGIVFWSSFLFLFGVLFAYYIIAPFTINFFANFKLSQKFQNIITISNYFDTMSSLVLGIGLVFELPIVVYFLSKIGIITPRFLKEKRRYAIVVITFISAIITPPDLFSLILVSIPLLILYEVGIIISARTVKEREKRTEDDTLDW